MDKFSDCELITAIVGRDIFFAQDIIRHFGDLHYVARASVDELMAVKGMSKKMATRLACSFELYRRKMGAEYRPTRFISSLHLVRHLCGSRENRNDEEQDQ